MKNQILEHTKIGKRKLYKKQQWEKKFLEKTKIGKRKVFKTNTKKSLIIYVYCEQKHLEENNFGNLKAREKRRVNLFVENIKKNKFEMKHT